jgi:FkbM family methyltransferase
MTQFLHTLKQVVQSDGVTPIRGVGRHVHWQIRKLFRQFPCELQLSQSRLFVNQSSGVAALVNAMGTYDYNNMSFLQVMLRRHGGTFIDVGANIGSYTLVASEVSFARIISIEPHPTTFDLLTENIRRNKRDNVTCLSCALSATDSECTLEDNIESSINRVFSGHDTRDDLLRVECRTLESVCRGLEVFPDFVKIDVEGHECAVLSGFGEFCTRARVISIEGGESAAVRGWMQEFGYLGPWFVHYKRHSLSTVRQARPEDPVFVHESYVTQINNAGFCFPT